MEGFKASYLGIEPSELVHFLLKESGQYERIAVNPTELLEYLKLGYISFDFDTSLPLEARPEGSRPRALLSFQDRLVAVDDGLSDPRRRFSVMHEIAHYVLPAHQHSLYLCDTRGMSPWTRLTFEKEANEFAADLLFKGGLFALDAAGMDISVQTVIALAAKYHASFEATARRLVEKSLRLVMLIVFKRSIDATQINVDAEPVWEVRYCVASPTFKRRFFTGVTGRVPPEVATELLSPLRDIEQSVARDTTVAGNGKERIPFRAEFFYNQYHILCLLTPGQVLGLGTSGARTDSDRGQR